MFLSRVSIRQASMHQWLKSSELQPACRFVTLFHSRCRRQTPFWWCAQYRCPYRQPRYRYRYAVFSLYSRLYNRFCNRLYEHRRLCKSFYRFFFFLQIPFLQILPTVAIIFFFRTDSTDFPVCLPIGPTFEHIRFLLFSVFFSVFRFLVVGFVR